MPEITLAPVIDPAKEVRLAVVLYGGVSLAIYINGVAQELLHLVRATAADPASPDGTRRARFKDYDEGHAGETAYLTEIEQVYRDIAKERLPAGSSPGDAPITTRYSVDVISGASAGGINGIFVGKAISNGKGLAELQNLWLREAEFDLLLNDEVSVRGEGLAPQEPPQSLLNSQRLYLQLLKALRAMDTAGSDGKGPLQPELDVYVTTTDIEGLPVALEVMGHRVEERRHKFAFHFQHPEKPGEKTPDFSADCSPFLAFAARATSSFPVAFEPMRLSDIDGVVELVYGANTGNSDSRLWRKFMKPFIDTTVEDAFKLRAFTDGGTLDNKPFGYAIDALLAKEADVPVDRKLLYVEPDPEEILRPKVPAERPNFIEHSLKCLVSLPGYETIREDVERVLERNRMIERVKHIITAFEERGTFDQADRTIGTREWAKQETTGREPAFIGYFRLKVSVATDGLAKMMAAAAGLNLESDDLYAVRNLVRRWRDENYSGNDGERTLNQFLLDFDFAYRERRLFFIVRHIDRRIAEANTTQEVRRTFRDFKRRLRGCLDELRRRRDEMFSNLALKKAIDAFRTRLLREHGITRDDAREQAPDQEDNERASSILREELRRWLRKDFAAGVLHCRELQDIGDVVAREFQNVFTDLRNKVHEHLNREEEIAKGLLTLYGDFDSYDAAVFPTMYGTGAGTELDPIEIIRVSPKDCPALIDQVEGNCKKLAGSKLAHFGALFKQSWRENDILWGRLDTAERLILTLIPGDTAEEKATREDFTRRAHRAILREAFSNRDEQGICQILSGGLLISGNGRPNESALEKLHENIKNLEVPGFPALSVLKNYYSEHFKTDGQFEPELTARELSRATTVVGEMLKDVADDYSVSKKPANWLVYTGWAMWGLIEMSMPGQLSNIFTKHWMSLLYLAGAVVLFVGSFFSSESAAFGWRIIGFTALAQVITIHIGRLLKPREATGFVPKVTTALRTVFSVAAGVAALMLSTGDPVGAAATFGRAWDRVAADAAASHLFIPGFAGWFFTGSLFATAAAGAWIGYFERRAINASRERLSKHPLMDMLRAEDLKEFWRITGDFHEDSAVFFKKALRVDDLFVGAYCALFMSIGAINWVTYLDIPQPLSLASAIFPAVLAVATGLFDLQENRRARKLLSDGEDASNPSDLVKARTASFRKWRTFFVTAGIAGLSIAALNLSFLASGVSVIEISAAVLLILGSIVGFRSASKKEAVVDAMSSVVAALGALMGLQLIRGLMRLLG